MAFDTPDNNGGSTPAPDPKSAIPASAGPTSDMPVGDLQAPTAPASQPPMQLQPAPQPEIKSRHFFKAVARSLGGAVLGTLVGQPPNTYTTDESGKQTAVPQKDTNLTRLRRIAEAALTGMAAGAEAPRRPGANALAGLGAGFTAEQQKLQQQDLLARKQDRENFEVSGDRVMSDTTSTQTQQTQTTDYDALAQQAGVQTTDGKQWHVHGDDLAELQKRDPNLKVIAPPSPYQPDYDALAKQAGAIQPPPSLTPEQARSRTLQNMTSAMAGQPMQNPDDQARAEEGRKAGTIQGGLDIAGGALLGPALEFLGFGGGRAAQQAAQQTAKQVGTGILDEHGNEIFRDAAPEVKQAAGKILKHPIVEKAVKMAVKKILGEEAGRRAGKAVGGDAGGYAGATLGALVGDKVLNWILSE